MNGKAASAKVCRNASLLSDHALGSKFSSCIVCKQAGQHPFTGKPIVAPIITIFDSRGCGRANTEYQGADSELGFPRFPHGLIQVMNVKPGPKCGGEEDEMCVKVAMLDMTYGCCCPSCEHFVQDGNSSPGPPVGASCIASIAREMEPIRTLFLTSSDGGRDRYGEYEVTRFAEQRKSYYGWKYQDLIKTGYNGMYKVADL